MLRQKEDARSCTILMFERKQFQKLQAKGLNNYFKYHIVMTDFNSSKQIQDSAAFVNLHPVQGSQVTWVCYWKCVSTK